MATQFKQQVNIAPPFDPIEDEGRPQTKKQRILQLHAEGKTDILALAREVDTSLNYVASVLTDAGLLTGYYDLFTSTAHPMNQYGKLFLGALSFKNLEAAEASVARIDQLYRYFHFLNDHAGQHHAMVVAMTGRNRALACGKPAEAQVFTKWLVEHLNTIRPTMIKETKEMKG